MNFSRRFLLAALSTLALAANLAHAQDNVLRVGTDATFPPMEFVENGKRTGFDIELVEAMAKAMGKQVEWVDIDFKGLIPGLISQALRHGRVGHLHHRRAQEGGRLHRPLLRGRPGGHGQGRQHAIKKLSDLDGKKVTVQVGTKSVGYLQEHFPKVQRVEVEKNQEMFNLVDIGRADAAVTGKPAAFQYVRTRGGLRVLDEQLTTEEYGMALRKDTPELTKAVNAALAKLKADGTYAAIVKKWFSNTK